MKKILSVLGCIILALLCTFISSNMEFGGKSSKIRESDILSDSIVKQEVVEVSNIPTTAHFLYDSGELVAVITDMNKIDAFLEQVYEENYAENFPDTDMSIGLDFLIVEETTYKKYQDVDEDICQYLLERNNFSLNAYRIEFSDEEGVYEVIYVKNIDDFYRARDTYITNFISETAFDLITEGKTTEALSNYGEREVSVEIEETITVSQEYVEAKDIMTEYIDILQFFCYGDDTTPILYTVQEGDTLDGIATQNGLYSGKEIVVINNAVLTDTDEVLAVGTVINIREFDSPITVVVVREEITKEVVYPDSPIVKEDSSLQEGIVVVEREAENGSANVSRLVTYVNGEISSYEEISSIVTVQPQSAVYRSGTLEVKGIGTGSFRWPIENVIISCGWGCYAGHAAIDIQNRLNLYGLIYASDGGTVTDSGYQSANGYYVCIDHGNGLSTYYGHMRTQPYVSVGDVVSQGDVIGQIGMTGNASGPHVHFFMFYTSGGWISHANHISPCNYIGC